MCLNLCMSKVYSCLMWPEEGVGFPKIGVTGKCESPCGYWELSLGPLWKQQEFFEQSLQLLVGRFPITASISSCFFRLHSVIYIPVLFEFLKHIYNGYFEVFVLFISCVLWEYYHGGSGFWRRHIVLLFHIVCVLEMVSRHLPPPCWCSNCLWSYLMWIFFLGLFWIGVGTLIVVTSNCQVANQLNDALF